jgi:hypothetical protein
MLMQFEDGVVVFFGGGRTHFSSTHARSGALVATSNAYMSGKNLVAKRERAKKQLVEKGAKPRLPAK